MADDENNEANPSVENEFKELDELKLRPEDEEIEGDPIDVLAEEDLIVDQNADESGENGEKDQNHICFVLLDNLLSDNKIPEEKVKNLRRDIETELEYLREIQKSETFFFQFMKQLKTQEESTDHIEHLLREQQYESEASATFLGMQEKENQEVEALRSKLTKEDDKRLEFVSILTKLNEENNNLKLINERMRKEIKELKYEPKKMRTQNEKAEKALRQLEKETQTKQELIASQTTMLSDMEKLYEKRLEDIRNKENEEGQVMQKIKDKDNEIKKKQTQIFSSQEEVVKLKQEQLELVSESLEAFANQKNDEVSRNGALKREIEYFQNFKVQLQNHQKHLEEEREKVVDKNKRLMEEIAVLRNEYDGLEQKEKEVRKELELQINDFLREENTTTKAEKIVELKFQEVEKLEELVKKIREDQDTIQKYYQKLTIESERKAAESAQNKKNFIEEMDKIKVFEFANRELMKKYAMFEQQIKEVQQKYSMEKSEKNKFAKGIQEKGQSIAEILEKLKIVENEYEIFKEKSSKVDKTLNQVVRRKAEVETQQAALKAEIAKQRIEDEKLKNECKESMLEIEKLIEKINHTEDEMLKLKNMFEKGIEERNFTGVQLMDRNDELCILYEKANIQDSILKNSEKELQKREEECHRLVLELENLNRELAVVYKYLPMLRAQEKEKVSLFKQIDDTTIDMEKLSHELENPHNKRWVKDYETVEELPKDYFFSLIQEGNAGDYVKKQQLWNNPFLNIDAFKDLMKEKIRKLDESLNLTNEKILEKNILLQDITESSDKLRQLAVAGRDQTFDWAVTMNRMRNKIEEITRELMATIAELSLRQSEAINLEKQNALLRERLKEYKERMDKGEAPSQEIEDQFIQELQLSDKRKQQLLAREQKLQEIREMPAFVARTAAVPRPNVYPNLEDPLGLPIPYPGTFLPMMYAEPGATMRHVRKPDLRPIQL